MLCKRKLSYFLHFHILLACNNCLVIHRYQLISILSGDALPGLYCNHLLSLLVLELVIQDSTFTVLISDDITAWLCLYGRRPNSEDAGLVPRPCAFPPGPRAPLATGVLSAAPGRQQATGKWRPSGGVLQQCLGYRLRWRCGLDPDKYCLSRAGLPKRRYLGTQCQVWGRPRQVYRICVRAHCYCNFFTMLVG